MRLTTRWGYTSCRITWYFLISFDIIQTFHKIKQLCKIPISILGKNKRIVSIQLQNYLRITFWTNSKKKWKHRKLTFIYCQGSAICWLEVTLSLFCCCVINPIILHFGLCLWFSILLNCSFQQTPCQQFAFQSIKHIFVEAQL